MCTDGRRHLSSVKSGGYALDECAAIPSLVVARAGKPFAGRADRLLLLWVAVRTLGRLQRFFVDRQGGEGVVPVLRTGGAPVNEAKVGKRPAGAVGGQAMRLSPSVVLETPCLVSDGDNMLVRFGSHQVHGR